MFPKDFQAKDLLYLNKMVTPGLMTIVYWGFCAISILSILAFIIRMASLSGIILGLLLMVLTLFYVRVICEVLIVLFKINSNLQKIADKE